MEEKELQSMDKKNVYIVSSQNHTDFNTRAASRCKTSLRYSRGTRDRVRTAEASQDTGLTGGNTTDVGKALGIRKCPTEMQRLVIR
jgi:hypothetical protein